MKSEIVAQLGRSDLLLPSLIAKGLAANDRVKVRLSILQAAARHAREGEAIAFEFAEECRAAGIEPAPMQTLVEQAVSRGEGRLSAPGLSALGAAVWRDVAIMTEAVMAADTSLGEGATVRLAALQTGAPFGFDDDIALAHISWLTTVTAQSGDSLHRLIMDLHKLLNGLAVTHA
jgi:hypothetical protein